MNTLQLVQRIGCIKMGDIDGGAPLVEQLVHEMPNDVHIDIDMTADQILDVYREQPNDVKRRIGQLTTPTEVVIDVLDWLHMTETRQMDMMVKEDGVKNIQLILALVISGMFALWSAYSYSEKATALLGDQYHSSLTSYIINIYKVITIDPNAPPPPPQQ